MKDTQKLLEKEALRLLVILGKSYAEIAKAADQETASEILQGVEYAEQVLTDLINTRGDDTDETLL